MAVVEQFTPKQGIVSKMIWNHGLTLAVAASLLFWVAVAALVILL